MPAFPVIYSKLILFKKQQKCLLSLEYFPVLINIIYVRLCALHIRVSNN